MSRITVTWTASEKLQKQEYVETGKEPVGKRKFKFDLAELNQEQRKPIIDHLGLRWFILDMKATHDFNEKMPASSYLPAFAQDYDHQPTLSDIFSFVALEADARNEAQAHEAKVNAAKKKNQERLQAAYDKLRPQVDALVEQSDPAMLEAFSFSVEGVASFKPSGGRSSLCKLWRDGVRDIRKAKRKADKATWVAAHGSDHLKRVHARGYDAQRLYVTERAETEAPGFVVDFDGAAKWKDRSCPTMEALDAEAETEALGLYRLVIVVWLTVPAQNTVDDYDYYDFEECEAVVIRNYLGRYDLVKVL